MREFGEIAMGVSTNAILAFGFNICDEDEMPDALFEAGTDDDGGFFQFDYLAAREAGIEPPTMEYSESPEAQAVYRTYWAAKRDAEKAHPLDVIDHCSGECPMRFLAVRGTEIVARRGYPERLGEFPTITPEQIEAMREFCKRYELEWQEPGWHLFSMWN